MKILLFTAQPDKERGFAKKTWRMKNELETVHMQLPSKRMMVLPEAYTRSEEMIHVTILRDNHKPKGRRYEKTTSEL